MFAGARDVFIDASATIVHNVNIVGRDIHNVGSNVHHYTVNQINSIRVGTYYSTWPLSFTFLIVVFKGPQPLPDASHTRNRKVSPPDSICLPGTRRTILHTILSWTVDSPQTTVPANTRTNTQSDGAQVSSNFEPSKPTSSADTSTKIDRGETHVLFLYGPAGSGKSAIAQTIAEELDHRGNLAGSFFFHLGSSTRNHMDRFAITLASQMAHNIPESTEFVEVALTRLDRLDQIPITTQLDRLVYQPFLSVDKQYWKASAKSPFVFVIDGLDECVARQDALRFISQLLNFVKQHPQLPLRFLITTRLDHGMHALIEGSKARIENLSHYDTREDTAMLVWHTFKEVAKRGRIVRPSRERPWPSPDDVETIIELVDGSPILIRTLVEFIADDIGGFARTERLKRSLTTQTGLDDFYQSVLLDAQPTIHFSGVVFTLAHLRDPFSILELGQFLGIPIDEVRKVLMCARGLIRTPGDDRTKVTFFHPSVRDFIQDRSRSSSLFSSKWQSRDEAEQSLRHSIAYHCGRILLVSAHSSSVAVHHYADQFWTHHLSECLIGGGNETSHLDRREVQNLFDTVVIPIFHRIILPNSPQADPTPVILLLVMLALNPNGVVEWEPPPVDLQLLLGSRDTPAGGGIVLDNVVPWLRILGSSFHLPVLELELRTRLQLTYPGWQDVSHHTALVVDGIQMVVDYGQRSPAYSYILFRWAKHLAQAVEDDCAVTVKLLQASCVPRVRPTTPSHDFFEHDVRLSSEEFQSFQDGVQRAVQAIENRVTGSLLETRRQA
jgi:energy-coupling factor transporter ATP-binding protein EcfA2